MNDPSLQDFARDAFEDTWLASMIRTSVRDVVERTLATGPGNARTREDIRAAGQRLGNALTAYVHAAGVPATTRRAKVRTSSTTVLPGDGVDARAPAFTFMAGVSQ